MMTTDTEEVFQGRYRAGKPDRRTRNSKILQSHEKSVKGAHKELAKRLSQSWRMIKIDKDRSSKFGRIAIAEGVKANGGTSKDWPPRCG
jgi:hypothetical protein